MSEALLKTAVSGSFKFKPEIDELHEEFADYGVKVIEPTKGWLWTPSSVYDPGAVRPLPAELGLDEKEIELRFLRAILRSHFLYLHNKEGYVGLLSAFEIGFTAHTDKSIYAKEPVDCFELAGGDLETMAYLKERIVVASIADIVKIEQLRLELGLADSVSPAMAQ